MAIGLWEQPIFVLFHAILSSFPMRANCPHISSFAVQGQAAVHQGRQEKVSAAQQQPVQQTAAVANMRAQVRGPRVIRAPCFCYFGFRSSGHFMSLSLSQPSLHKSCQFHNLARAHILSGGGFGCKVFFPALLCFHLLQMSQGRKVPVQDPLNLFLLQFHHKETVCV